jgi:hypothetical protein
VAANAEGETTGASGLFITVAAAEWPLTGGFIYIYGTLKGFFLKNCFEFIYLFYGD